tara:strand:- start:16109 stop:16651 length:543 start_codon:yes stop_codon:yes gene_type:complete
MAKGVPAIILAAGASTRLGQPKALVQWGGESLVAKAVRILSDCGCNPIVVVTRTELQVDIMLECEGAIVIVNPSPEDGRTGTLQIGIRSLISELGRTPSKILICPVDRCGWNEKTVRSLLTCRQNTSPQPSGHPLLLCDIESILLLRKDASLRDSISILKIDAPGIHLNIDTPEDLEALP